MRQGRGHGRRYARRASSSPEMTSIATPQRASDRQRRSPRRWRPMRSPAVPTATIAPTRCRRASSAIPAMASRRALHRLRSRVGRSAWRPSPRRVIDGAVDHRLPGAVRYAGRPRWNFTEFVPDVDDGEPLGTEPFQHPQAASEVHVRPRSRARDRAARRPPAVGPLTRPRSCAPGPCPCCTSVSSAMHPPIWYLVRRLRVSTARSRGFGSTTSREEVAECVCLRRRLGTPSAAGHRADRVRRQREGGLHQGHPLLEPVVVDEQ